MPRHSAVFHPSARDELAAAHRWYRDRSPAAANAFLFEIERALGLILESPDRWPTHVHGTRRLLLKRFPFVVIFSSTPSTVRIYAIAHGRRSPGYWRSQLDPGSGR